MSRMKGSTMKAAGGSTLISRFGKFFLAAILAVSLMPITVLTAFAVGVDEQGGNDLDLQLANQQWVNSENKEFTIWDDGYWSLRDDATGTYVWTTVIQGDDAHYGNYDVDITFTVNDKKELTAVDITSNGTTFGGIWGNVNKTSTISGYLPTGVENTTEVIDQGSDKLVALSLGGDVDKYDTSYNSTGRTPGDESAGNGGYSISSITLFQAAADGSVSEYATDEDGNIIYDLVYDEEDGEWEMEPRINGVTISSSGVSSDEEVATYDSDTQTITVKDDTYNLVATDYVIGSFYTFTQYTALDEGAAKFDIDQTDYSAEPSGIAEKNRDNYTLAVYSIMIQHELAMFMNNGTLEADIDTVSAATKSSWAIQEAVYAALGYYYPVTNKVEYDTAIAPTVSSDYPDPIFTDVSGSLKMTIDGNKSVWDETAASVNEDGTFTFDATDYDESLTIGSLALYHIDKQLSGTELFDLGLKNGSTLVKAIQDGEDVSDTGYLAGWLTSNSAGHGIPGALDSGEVSGDATWDADTNTMTINNTEANYVVVGYSVAKSNNGSYGQVCVAYSLDDLLAAGGVNELIEAMSVYSSEEILAANAAYENLSTSAKLFVTRDDMDKLTAAVEKLESLTFPDVMNPDEYYYYSVYDMVLRGVITGYENGYFGVGDSLTRAQMVTMLWRYCDPEGYANYDESSAVNETSLPDIENGQYYTGAANWAVEKGVVTGNEVNGSYYFNPGDQMTFEQMITVVARYVLGFDGAAEYDASVLNNSRFTDGATVDEFARGAVAWAIDEGIVTGNNNQDGTYTIAPLTSVERERAATVLCRMINSDILVAS